jgi:ubiquinone/menaquinone biosynthesis C-methylase UbiE
MDVDPAASVNPFVDEFRLLAEGGNWPVAADSINCVIADFVLEHLPQPELFFGEANRALNKGGFLCARTPNKWGYVALAARVIPKSAHSRVLSKAQPDRKENDVFPAFYRCNTVTTLRKYLHNYGFQGVVYGFEAEPSYLNFSQLTYRLGTVVHRILPNRLRSSLFVFAEKL